MTLQEFGGHKVSLSGKSLGFGSVSRKVGNNQLRSMLSAVQQAMPLTA